MNTIQTTNRELISNVYVEMQESVYSIFRQMCIPEEDCEDLVQDVFVKVLKLDIIQEDCINALVVKIAYQKRIDYFRHRYYINKVHNNMTGWAMENSYYNTSAEVNDILRVEMKVMSRMSELDRKTYILSRFDDKTTEEIAMTLNMTKKAVDSRLYRTRKLVRNDLKKAIGY